MQVTYADIEAAHQRISDAIVLTPLIACASASGERALVKLETMQHTGSFKFRGAINRIRMLTRAERARGVVAYSSGNHGLAVAEASRREGVSAVVVAPSDAPSIKLSGIKSAGAHLVTYDRAHDDRAAIAKRFTEDEQRTLIEPFDHAQTIAGQGSLAIEAVAQARAMGVEIERVLCCCGGGGLLAGVAIAMRNFYPNVEIIGVEPETQADTLRSLKLGRPVSAEHTGPTLCDSLMSPVPGALTFSINQRLVNDIVLVSDDDVTAAMRYAFTSMKSVIEPGGAAALGAYLAGKVQSGVQTTLITASGGNVDRDVFARILAA